MAKEFFKHGYINLGLILKIYAIFALLLGLYLIMTDYSGPRSHLISKPLFMFASCILFSNWFDSRFHMQGILRLFGGIGITIILLILLLN